jgi:spore maturation protein SpmA
MAETAAPVPAIELMFTLIQFLVFWLGFLGAAPSDAAFTYLGVLAIVGTIGALFVHPRWFL